MLYSCPLDRSRFQSLRSFLPFSFFLPFAIMAAAVDSLPQTQQMPVCYHAHECTPECYYGDYEETHKCAVSCDCPCIDCCIQRFATEKKACSCCGGDPVEGTDRCKDCPCDSDSESDYNGYDRDDDDRSYSRSEHEDEDDYDSAGCRCNRCGCAYDPEDSDYGRRACSEACFEGWGEDY